MYDFLVFTLVSIAGQQKEQHTATKKTKLKVRQHLVLVMVRGSIVRFDIGQYSFVKKSQASLHTTAISASGKKSTAPSIPADSTQSGMELKSSTSQKLSAFAFTKSKKSSLLQQQ